jgi:hypothetical protein
MQRRTGDAFSIGPRRLIRAAVVFGSVGVGVAVLLLGISACCVDQATPGTGLRIYNAAYKWVWPTSSYIPEFVIGPHDRQAILLKVVTAVAMNAIPYAVIGAGFAALRTALGKPRA